MKTGMIKLAVAVAVVGMAAAAEAGPPIVRDHRMPPVIVRDRRTPPVMG